MRFSRKSAQLHGEINVTPLVDVMLVLLIIFMVTAPMMSVNVPVDLPQTQGISSAEEKDPLIISMDAHGKIFLKDTQMPLEKILNQLKENSKGLEERIFIRADKKLPYGVVMEMMGKLSKAGFARVSLMGEEA